MKIQRALSKEIETQIMEYIAQHEFFWVDDLKKHMAIGSEPPAGQINGSRYVFFYDRLDRLKKANLIICTEKRGNARQYFSTLFVNK